MRIYHIRAMSILFAFLSALFAGVVAILAKVAMKHIDSNLATFLRTIVVLLFCWIMVLVTRQWDFSGIKPLSLLFLGLSGLATGLSWIFYFKAIELGEVHKVAPIDKSSVLLSILLSFFLLNEAITLGKVVGFVLIAIGTYLCLPSKKEKEEKRGQLSSNDPEKEKKTRKSWLFYALLSALFAALTAILGKLGVQNVPSNLATALRTIVVLFMAFLIVLSQKKLHLIKALNKKDLLFLALSGIATGLSWLCYYRALKDGSSSLVVSIDKSSLLISVLFSVIFLKEKVSLRYAIGLGVMMVGILGMVLIPDVFSYRLYGDVDFIF